MPNVVCSSQVSGSCADELAAIMDDATRGGLNRSQVINLSTTGRRSGARRRIEIFLHSVNGQLFISGQPFPGRTRAWLHNVTADPHVTIHLKGTIVVDVPATARLIHDSTERRPPDRGGGPTLGSHRRRRHV